MFRRTDLQDLNVLLIAMDMLESRGYSILMGEKRNKITIKKFKEILKDEVKNV